MKAVSRILVPLDGSRLAMKGLDAAIVIAKAHGASITCVHAQHPKAHAEFVGNRASLNNADKIMEEAKARVVKHGIVFQKRVVSGDPGYGIVKVANRKDAFDMIVISSHGKSSVKSIFFGSVSNYIIHAAKVPVLVIK